MKLIVVDEDQSEASRDLVTGAQSETLAGGEHEPGGGEEGRAAAREYTAATAEAAVKAGDAPVALIIPQGFGQHPIAFGPGAEAEARLNC